MGFLTLTDNSGIGIYLTFQIKDRNEMKRLLALSLLTVASVVKGQNSSTDQKAPVIESSKSWMDIDYAGDGIVGHKLDIYLPKNGQGPFPIVVAIYGSAWFSNSSKNTVFNDGLGQALLNNGFAVVTINHRSSADAKFPAQIHDVKAALRFTRANAARFSLDSNFMGITGFSSGGHLSSLAASTSGITSITVAGEMVDLEGQVGKYPGSDSRVDAVVDWFGPTDFLIMDSCGSSFSHNDAKSPESSLIGGPIQEHPLKVIQANPISYVNESCPHFLIIHGDQDPLVPLCESQKLFARLQKDKVQSELIVVPGGKHGPGVMIGPYYDKMVSFFKKELASVRKASK